MSIRLEEIEEAIAKAESNKRADTFKTIDEDISLDSNTEEKERTVFGSKPTKVITDALLSTVDEQGNINLTEEEENSLGVFREKYGIDDKEYNRIKSFVQSYPKASQVAEESLGEGSSSAKAYEYELTKLEANPNATKDDYRALSKDIDRFLQSQKERKKFQDKYINIVERRLEALNKKKMPSKVKEPEKYKAWRKEIKNIKELVDRQSNYQEGSDKYEELGKSKYPNFFIPVRQSKENSTKYEIGENAYIIQDLVNYNIDVLEELQRRIIGDAKQEVKPKTESTKTESTETVD